VANGFGLTDLFSTGLELLGATGPSSSLDFGLPVSYPVYQPSYSFDDSYPVAQKSVPAPSPDQRALMQRAVGAGLPSWSAKFPSLWQFLVTKGLGGGALGTMLSLLAKWGPTALTALWGAQVVGDLISYKASHKRRRMNPANAKALRRSIRRLKSFDRLSHRVSAQLGRVARSGRKTSRRHCNVCRSSPCRC
jgi:hypothetical protein